MYVEFRLDLLCELSNAGLDDDALRCVMAIIDRLGGEYDVSRKCTALVPIEATAQRVMLEYLACKSLEGYSKQTLTNYHKTLDNFIISMKKRVEDIRTNDIRAYLYHYQMTRGVSNRSLDKVRTVIASFFHWAYSEGKVERDPSLAINPIKYVIEPKPSLTQIDLENIRKNLGDKREKAIIEMFYSTGCRVSELCGMKKSDVDWDHGTVKIFGKGGKYRTGFLNAKAIVSLTDYLATRTDSSPFLFVSDRKPHGQLTRAAVEKIVRLISERSFNLTGKNITPHIFRHTTITTALRNGMPLQNVSKMAGHSQVKTTMDYATIDTSDVQHDHSRYVI